MSASSLHFVMALNWISLGLKAFDQLVCDGIFGVLLLVVECVLLLLLLLLLFLCLLFVFKKIEFTQLVFS